jgi:transposase
MRAAQDDPMLRHITLLMATLDPLGLPLAVDVVSGEQADNPLDAQTIGRVLSCLLHKGLLFVGDCKMSAASTRAHLVTRKPYDLTPLALVGETAELLPQWIEAGVA